MVTVSDLAERTGLDPAAVARALDRSTRTTSTSEDHDRRRPDVLVRAETHPQARRAEGQWPTLDSFVTRMAAELSAAAAQEEDAERKSLPSDAARLIGDSLRDVAVRLAGQVLARRPTCCWAPGRDGAAIGDDALSAGRPAPGHGPAAADGDEAAGRPPARPRRARPRAARSAGRAAPRAARSAGRQPARPAGARPALDAGAAARGAAVAGRARAGSAGRAGAVVRDGAGVRPRRRWCWSARWAAGRAGWARPGCAAGPTRARARRRWPRRWRTRPARIQAPADKVLPGLLGARARS